MVIDFNHVQYDEHDEVIHLAHACADQGMMFGVQTDNPTDPRLHPLVAAKKIEITRSHLQALVLIRKNIRSRIAEPVA